jgi:hypothetical protein
MLRSPRVVMDDSSIRFGWTLRSEDAERIKQALDAAHPERLAEREAPAARGGDPEIEDLLLSVGLHLDQEVTELAGAQIHLEGLAPAAALFGSVEDVLREAPTGFIVDTRFSTVEIDQHPSVGRGTVVLVDQDGARLLGSGQGAALLKSLEEAEAAREA